MKKVNVLILMMLFSVKVFADVKGQEYPDSCTICSETDKDDCTRVC